MRTKLKGYLAERRVRKAFEARGWTTIRSGGSVGYADLVCLKNKTCLLLQVKATRRKSLNVKGLPSEIAGFPLFLVVDFGYGCLKVFRAGEFASKRRGTFLKDFLAKLEGLE
jgi:hypothetical protein